MRVSYNGITSAFQADDAGSIPATRSKLKPRVGGLCPGKIARVAVFAHIAQSVEHFLGKEEVTGSNPVMGSSLA